ncbi:MAG: hypothetical protein ACLPKB_25600 [Xanthobacteraceae bacterium]
MARTPEETITENAIWGGPAFLANRVWVVYSGQMVRITFGEQGGPEETPRFRTAVGLTPADAIAFAELLKNVVKPYEEEMKAQQKATEK